jgi:hypothetical protein
MQQPAVLPLGLLQRFFGAIKLPFPVRHIGAGVLQALGAEIPVSLDVRQPNARRRNAQSHSFPVHRPCGVVDGDS